MVSEEAVEAAAEAAYTVKHQHSRTASQPWSRLPEISKNDERNIARRVLSAAAAHMGTGQSEADLRARIAALADPMTIIRWMNEVGASDMNVNVCMAYIKAALDRPAAEGDE